MARTAWRFLLGFALACGSNAPVATAGGSASTKAATTEAVAACTRSASALCARGTACAETWVLAAFGSQAECTTIVARHCTHRYEGAFAESAPAACEPEANAVACPVFARVVKDAMMLDPAEAFLHFCPVRPGTRHVAETCATDGDCDTGSCDGAPSRACGHCVEPAGEGAACVAARDCAAGLACVQNRCTKLLEPGASCLEGGHDCATDLCGVDRTCSPFHREGDACAGSRCGITGMACTNGRCVKPASVTAGAPCSEVALCNATSRCNGVTCESRAGAGGVCFFDADCVSGLRCAKTCKESTREDLSCGL